MFSLVLKDILIQKKNLFAILIYPFIGILAFGFSFGSSTGYIFSIISIGYVMILTASGYDEKNKFDVVLNSLPLKRDDAVIAKYMSVAVFFVMGSILTAAAGIVVKLTGLFPYINIIKLSDVLLAACSLCLYYAIYFPLNYKFGAIKMKLINMLIYMVFIFVPMFVAGLIKDNPDDKSLQAVLHVIGRMSSSSVSLIIAAAVLILLVLSINISIGIYRNKDF